MAKAELNIDPSEASDTVAVLEALILSIDGVSTGKARRALRQFLFERAGGQDASGSVADALSLLASTTRKDILSAIVILRCLAVDGLVPESNSTNSIARFVAELCEGALPELYSFLKIDRKLQNFEKFGILVQCHSRILRLLAPLSCGYGELDALLSARKDILGSLNHGIVKLYADPFNLKEVRTTIEAVFGRIKKVAALEPTVLTDIEDCKSTISKAQAECQEIQSFLVQQFLVPFLVNSNAVLDDFLASLRNRFITEINRGGIGRTELQKRYPLHEVERELQIAIPLKVSGPGMAIDLRATFELTSKCITLNCNKITLGNVLPGEFAVTFDVMVVEPCDKVEGVLEVRWGEIGNPIEKSQLFEVEFLAQSHSIDWAKLTYAAPYSTEVAKGEQFIGRKERVQFLASKLLRQPMEPFYITGQKRIGKTSLAIAAADFAKSNEHEGSLDYIDILWGSVAHADPVVSLRLLGEEIETFVRSKLPAELNVPKNDYKGSLAPLIGVLNLALRNRPKQRYVVILDEFDDIPQDLFLHGNLADTFFANLRALSRCQNICIVLVGGENMPFIMERQGEKLNNFSRVNLSYFSREREWYDFQELVRKPTEDILSWHDDAISELFNATHGNPFYAKLICAGVFRSAVVERDADITARELRRTIESEVSALGANSFVHLWRDGIPKPASEREPDILRRMRTLVAIARCMRGRNPTTMQNIVQSKASTGLADTEVSAVLHDFVKREVLEERDACYEFKLPIFSSWLIDVGAGQLVVDSMSEELANIVIAEENEAIVRSEEVVSLAKSWPTYRGKHIGTDEIRAWYQQVESPKDQRILFELLKRTRMFQESHVRERLKGARSFVQASLPEFVMRKKGERRDDIIVTYVDGPGKSGASYASMFAEENGISASSVFSREDFRSQWEKHVRATSSPNALVIVDDIAATGTSLSANIATFLEDYGQLIGATKIRVVTILNTEVAQKRIIESFRKLDGIDIDFRSCEVLAQEHFAFPERKVVWTDNEQRDRAQSLCNDLGCHIYKGHPLGFGGLGLLVVFPTTVPNNSLPILHSSSRTGSSKKWRPLFERIVN